MEHPSLAGHVMDGKRDATLGRPHAPPLCAVWAWTGPPTGQSCASQTWRKTSGPSGDNQLRMPSLYARTDARSGHRPHDKHQRGMCTNSLATAHRLASPLPRRCGHDSLINAQRDHRRPAVWSRVCHSCKMVSPVPVHRTRPERRCCTHNATKGPDHVHHIYRLCTAGTAEL